MRIGHKYIFPPFIALFFFLLGGAGVLIADIIVELAARGLAEWMPSLFARPNAIADPEGYESYLCSIELVTLTLTLLPVTYLSMRLDNKRFEHLIVLTEGLYTLPRALRWHLRSFWLSDIISASLPPILLTLPVFLVPEEYLSGILGVLWCGARLSPYFSAVWATVTVVAISLVMRLLLLPAVLRAWRASWLSGSVD